MVDGDVVLAHPFIFGMYLGNLGVHDLIDKEFQLENFDAMKFTTRMLYYY